MTSFMNSPWAAFYVVCCMLSAPVSQCSVYSVFTFPSLWLPPTLPPPATHPTPSCHPPYGWLPGPPAATNHRAGCLPPYPLLPPTLPPPATQPTPSCHHPMTCVRTPPSCHQSLHRHKYVLEMLNLGLGGTGLLKLFIRNAMQVFQASGFYILALVMTALYAQF